VEIGFRFNHTVQNDKKIHIILQHVMATNENENQGQEFLII
jgi:hypothetical protein